MSGARQWFGRPPRLTPEQAAELRRLYAERRALPSRGAMAAELGLTRMQLNHALDRSVRLSKRLPLEVRKRIAAYREAWHSTLRIGKLAERYGLSITAVRWYINGTHKRAQWGDL
jgi:N-acetyl-beta-hexosaminidase